MLIFNVKDCNSIIASWNPNEVHEKLQELIRENEKLKETLKQNNVVMKQQFNSVASWQEEIMKIYENHKKKFAETKELVNCLKKENAELKSKITSGSNSLESAYELFSINEVQNCKELAKSSNSEMKFQESLSAVDPQLKCKVSAFDAEKLVSISNIMSSQLNQAISTLQEQSIAIKELKSQHAMSKSYNSNDSKPLIVYNTPECVETIIKCTDCEKCLPKDEKTNSLREADFIFERKLQTNAPVHIVDLNKHSQQENQQFQQWEANLRLLNQISKEIEAYGIIKNSLEKYIEVLQSQSSESSSFSDHRNLKTQKLENYFHQLHQVLKKNISKLHEIGVVPKEEDIRETNATAVSLTDVTKLIEKNAADKRLQEQVSDLVRKTEDLQEEKHSIDFQKNILQVVIINLAAEKKKYEEMTHQLVAEVGTLHETIQKQNSEIYQYQKQICDYCDNINILEEQAKIFENDFNIEHEQKRQLLEEKSKMEEDIRRYVQILKENLVHNMPEL
ncbi:uncharacterized protein LOC144478825 isoform X2 [Augochlora pura]